jgi:hypothetical protein
LTRGLLGVAAGGALHQHGEAAAQIWPGAQRARQAQLAVTQVGRAAGALPAEEGARTCRQVGVRPLAHWRAGAGEQLPATTGRRQDTPKRCSPCGAGGRGGRRGKRGAAVMRHPCAQRGADLRPLRPACAAGKLGSVVSGYDSMLSQQADAELLNKTYRRASLAQYLGRENTSASSDRGSMVKGGSVATTDVELAIAAHANGGEVGGLQAAGPGGGGGAGAGARRGQAWGAPVMLPLLPPPPLPAPLLLPPCCCPSCCRPRCCCPAAALVALPPPPAASSQP